ncbi:hypothetical protein EC973_002080 [Apophysomyces ossiformis]|uniref:Uncharacterized protein n=1 Tax=Apophysomyces ossiformis TaxID=679940 RepID=A0A8H7ELZ2_9FUNG|nr:hypothetical protein EC973_002080 [Apophysomyces ossiformis]
MGLSDRLSLPTSITPLLDSVKNVPEAAVAATTSAASQLNPAAMHDATASVIDKASSTVAAASSKVNPNTILQDHAKFVRNTASSVQDTATSTMDSAISFAKNPIKYVCGIILVLFQAFFEIAVPFALYFLLAAFVSPVLAAIVAGLQVLFVVVLKRCCQRTTDTLGVMLLSGFFICAAFNLACNHGTLLTLRNSTLSLSMGIVMLATLLPIEWKKKHQLRPLLYYLVQNMNPLDSTRTAWKTFWKTWPYLRKVIRIETALCGIALASKFLLQWYLILADFEDEEIAYYTNAYMACMVSSMLIMLTIGGLLLRHKHKRISNPLNVDHKQMFRGILYGTA